MQLVIETLKNIIKSKAGIVPAYIYDDEGIFDIFMNSLGLEFDVSILKNDSKIALQNILREKQFKKNVVIYSCFYIDLDSMVVAKKLQPVEITGELILNACEQTKEKIKGSILLTAEQTKLFLNNFENIVKSLSSYEKINDEVVKLELARYVIGRKQSIRELIVSYFKNEITLENLKNLNLHEQVKIHGEKYSGISVSDYPCGKNLVSKVLITLHSKRYKGIGAEYNDYLLSLDEDKLIRAYNFIKSNEQSFVNEISETNRLFLKKNAEVLSYFIPKLFENFIAENISNYSNIVIDKDRIWTKDMEMLTNFVDCLAEMDNLLNQYVSFSFMTNTIGEILKEYKEVLYLIDTKYREISGLYESLSFNFDVYVKVEKAQVYQKVTDKYFNVLSNINSKYISGFDLIVSENSNSIRQDEVIKSIKFRKNTVFIFADGLRYEMAKPLKNDMVCEEVVDYNVYSAIPTETEIGMNGYFITDEKLRLNSKNVFELVKNNKIIVQIINWRMDKLSEIIGDTVIPFEEFKKTKDYSGSVIYFYNDVDNALHSYNSSRKVTNSVIDLRTAIQYSIDRNFDVMLLSDHGFIDIGSKIQLQDNEIDSEKKKSRYLILNSNEKVNTMYYQDCIKIADFIEMENKKICFINSVNSLRQTTRYTHGGISLQETVITALLFKAFSQEEINRAEFIQNVEAFNELKIDIKGAKGGECSVYIGPKKIFMCIVEEDDYIARVPIRNYSKGEEFLIVINKGELIEKHTIKKSGMTVIDKDLDIF